MVFKIMYKFLDEETTYTCYMTHKQYINFQTLPTVTDVAILKRNQVEMKEYLDEMQHSLDAAFANSTSHIRNLSEAL